MPRATTIVDVAHPEEIAASEGWFTKWTTSITYRSDNQGYGCCVNIWDVEGSDDAMAALPIIRGQSKWADEGAREA
jgi:hypothetical protein